MKKFKSFGEYLLAIKRASELGEIDSRLILKVQKNQPLTEEEVLRMEKFADYLEKTKEEKQ